MVQIDESQLLDIPMHVDLRRLLMTLSVSMGFGTADESRCLVPFARWPKVA